MADILTFAGELNALVADDSAIEFVGRCEELSAERSRMKWVTDSPAGGCWALQSAWEVERQLELTRLVLGARRLLVEDPDSVKAEAVLEGRRPGERWLRRITADGFIWIECAGPSWARRPILGNAPLPLEHRERVPAAIQ